MLLVVIADKVHLKRSYRAEFKLTLSALFVERSKKTPSLKSASLSTRRFAAYAYFFEVAWRSNLDNNSRDRVRACKTHGFHCRPLKPGKYATEIRGPRHVQLFFGFFYQRYVIAINDQNNRKQGKGKFSQGKGGTKTCHDSSIGSCVRASVTEARVTV